MSQRIREALRQFGPMTSVQVLGRVGCFLRPELVRRHQTRLQRTGWHLSRERAELSKIRETLKQLTAAGYVERVDVGGQRVYRLLPPKTRTIRSRKWTTEEAQDAHLEYEDFEKKYPHLSRSAWQSKRERLGISSMRKTTDAQR